MQNDIDWALSFLKKNWGFDEFRPLQKKIIEAVFSQSNVLGIMATGGGKSLCFQIPALMAEGLTWVISPLISLMKDQVERLNEVGIRAIRLTSDIPSYIQQQELEELKKHNNGLVYISPEKLKRSDIMKFWRDYPPAYVVVDEAHCISLWGHDFRPDYYQLGARLNQLRHGPVLAFTATASPTVREEIISVLGGSNWESIIGSFVRENIRLHTYYGSGKVEKFNELMKTVKTPMIVFANSRARVEKTAAYMAENFTADVAAFHAGLESHRKTQLQNMFLNDELEVLVATSAFGMGVDKSNIRTIIHLDLAPTVDAFYQEMGRAGRDGEEADHYLLQTEFDVDNLTRRILNKFPELETARSWWKELNQTGYNRLAKDADPKQLQTTMEHWWVSDLIRFEKTEKDWLIFKLRDNFEEAWNKLEAFKTETLKRFYFLEKYVHVDFCRMQYLVNYFDEKAEPCGKCDVCLNPVEKGASEYHSAADRALLRKILEVDGQYKLKALARHLILNPSEKSILLKDTSIKPLPDLIEDLHRLTGSNLIRAPRLAGFNVFLTGKGRYLIDI